ncbi:MAG: spore maturation protein [Clostridia bacterium]|nr:spore maturation protein [Clostridia bacterium]
MNAIFSFLFIVSALIMLFIDPAGFLSALVEGAGKSASLCIALLGTYAVWLGLMRVWEDSGVSAGVSRLLKPLSRKLFKTDDEQTLTAISMNLSANLLGLSGASTPYGIKAAQLLDKSEHAEYSSAMFFVLNATSIQLIPTSIIGVRTALKSAAPADIVLPTLLTTAFSTLLGVALTALFLSPRRAVQKRGNFLKKREAGSR